MWHSEVVVRIEGAVTERIAWLSDVRTDCINEQVVKYKLEEVGVGEETLNSRLAQVFRDKGRTIGERPTGVRLDHLVIGLLR